MKTVTANFTNMRNNSVIPGTKTRVTISQYDDAWALDSDTDITDYLLKGQPDLASELQDSFGVYKKDNLNIELEDEDETIRTLLAIEDKYFLILIEKGFSGIADWVVIFDGIVDTYETIDKARNIISITAYSMEEELEMHDATNSATSGAVNQTITQLVNDLWDLSYINIPVGNRTISVPPQLVPLADYTGWNAREALDNLAQQYGCIWKRTERDTAMFVSKNYIGGTLNLNNDLYSTYFDKYNLRKIDGVHVENTAAGVEAYSPGWIEGINQDYNNQLLTDACPQCAWCADEIYSSQAYNRRLWYIPGFYLLELEPLDRVNLTLREKDNTFKETIETQFIGTEYSDSDKITRIKLEERMPRLYERCICEDVGDATIAGLIWQAQTYTIGAESYNQAHNIVRVRLLMWRRNNPGNLTVGIRNTVAGQPAGGDLCTVTVNANTFTAVSPGLWYEFVFTTTAAQALATQYAIVCRCPGAIGANDVQWRRLDITHPASTYDYSGGNQDTSTDGGVSWNGPYTDFDFMFECWGEQ